MCETQNITTIFRHFEQTLPEKLIFNFILFSFFEFIYECGTRTGLSNQFYSFMKILHKNINHLITLYLWKYFLNIIIQTKYLHRNL